MDANAHARECDRPAVRAAVVLERCSNRDRGRFGLENFEVGRVPHGERRRRPVVSLPSPDAPTRTRYHRMIFTARPAVPLLAIAAAAIGAMLPPTTGDARATP